MQILLVEDDNMLAEAIGFGLRQDHWEIDRAEDGVAAQLALVEHTSPYCSTSDYPVARVCRYSSLCATATIRRR